MLSLSVFLNLLSPRTARINPKPIKCTINTLNQNTSLQCLDGSVLTVWLRPRPWLPSPPLLRLLPAFWKTKHGQRKKNHQKLKLVVSFPSSEAMNYLIGGSNRGGIIWGRARKVSHGAIESIGSAKTEERGQSENSRAVVSIEHVELEEQRYGAETETQRLSDRRPLRWTFTKETPNIYLK